MDATGISVTEIRLGLPNTHYYLHWDPGAAVRGNAGRRALLRNARGIARRMDWRVFAAGAGPGGARLVFRTSADNLETGLAALLRDAHDYHVHIVQPADALPLIAYHVHRSGAADTDGASARMPAVHYRLFMGERPWAERMLELLTRCAGGAACGPARPASLTELARAHASTRDAIAQAYRCGRFSLKEIADHFGMHFSEVSAVINESREAVDVVRQGTGESPERRGAG